MFQVVSSEFLLLLEYQNTTWFTKCAHFHWNLKDPFPKAANETKCLQHISAEADVRTLCFCQNQSSVNNQNQHQSSDCSMDCWQTKKCIPNNNTDADFSYFKWTFTSFCQPSSHYCWIVVLPHWTGTEQLHRHWLHFCKAWLRLFGWLPDNECCQTVMDIVADARTKMTPCLCLPAPRHMSSSLHACWC